MGERVNVVMSSRINDIIERLRKLRDNSGGSDRTPGGGGPPPTPPPYTPPPGTPGSTPPPTPGGGGGGQGNQGGPPPGGGGGPPPPPPPPPRPGNPFPGATPPQSPDDTFDWNGRRYRANGFGQWERAPTPQTRAQVGWSVANTAVGVALGTSIMGLPLAGAQHYFQVSKALAELNARFRETAEGARMFGSGMGYTMLQSAQMAKALGGVQNTFGAAGATRMAGFARYVGLGQSPEQVLQTLGRVGELSGRRDLSDNDLALVLGRAKTMGLDQGRIGEFLQRVSGSAEQQFAATGQSSLSGALSVVGLPSVLYGADDPRRANDTTVATGLNSVMQSTPGRSFLMRAMGYGTANGLSYVDMKKRLDAGIYDPNNVVQMFEYMNRLGLSDTAKFQAIESVAGGSLRANQIEALVGRFGNAEGLSDYRAMVDQDPEGARKALGLSKGFTELGKENISLGESREQNIDKAMYDIGETVAPSIAELAKIMTNLIDTIKDVTGKDPLWEFNNFLKVTEAATSEVSELTDTIKDTREQFLDYLRQSGINVDRDPGKDVHDGAAWVRKQLGGK